MVGRGLMKARGSGWMVNFYCVLMMAIDPQQHRGRHSGCTRSTCTGHRSDRGRTAGQETWLKGRGTVHNSMIRVRYEYPRDDD